MNPSFHTSSAYDKSRKGDRLRCADDPLSLRAFALFSDLSVSSSHFFGAADFAGAGALAFGAGAEPEAAGLPLGAVLPFTAEPAPSRPGAPPRS